MSVKNTVLIVDDEPDLVHLASAILKTAGINTIESTCGEMAMKIIEENHGIIGMVLLDIIMPDKSGYDVLRDIKTNNFYKDITVYMFTVKNSKKDIEKSRKLGADGFILKPFPSKLLLECVQHVIGLRN